MPEYAAIECDNCGALINARTTGGWNGRDRPVCEPCANKRPMVPLRLMDNDELARSLPRVWVDPSVIPGVVI